MLASGRAKLLALTEMEETAELGVELRVARARDVVAFEARGEATRVVVRDAIALAELGVCVVRERDLIVEPRAKLTTRDFVEAFDRRREHDVLVDLGLQLELELRCFTLTRGAIGEIDEVTHALDDLTNRIETAGEKRKTKTHLEDTVLGLANEERFALAALRRRDEVVDVGGSIETIETFEPALDAARQRDLSNETGAVSRELVHRHERTRPPRGGTKP